MRGGLLEHIATFNMLERKRAKRLVQATARPATDIADLHITVSGQKYRVFVLGADNPDDTSTPRLYVP